MESIWSIPPPFETDSFGTGSLPQIQNRASSSMKKGSGRSSAGLKVRYSSHQAAMSVYPAEEDDIFMMGGRQPRMGTGHLDQFPKKEAPWIPATKHRHAYKGCAPNGMRLFEPAPSLLLSRKKKMARDQGLKHQLVRLKDEISTFEASNLSMTSEGGNSKSLSALTAAHGRMVQDLREMQQVVDNRCASRWEPGLGRRALPALHSMSQEVGFGGPSNL
jgi:hypothetical protein